MQRISKLSINYYFIYQEITHNDCLNCNFQQSKIYNKLKITVNYFQSKFKFFFLDTQFLPRRQQKTMQSQKLMQNTEQISFNQLIDGFKDLLINLVKNSTQLKSIFKVIQNIKTKYQRDICMVYEANMKLNDYQCKYGRDIQQEKDSQDKSISQLPIQSKGQSQINNHNIASQKVKFKLDGFAFKQKDFYNPDQNSNQRKTKSDEPLTDKILKNIKSDRKPSPLEFLQKFDLRSSPKCMNNQNLNLKINRNVLKTK